MSDNIPPQPVLEWKREDAGPLVIGHRGFPAKARENTPESFRWALSSGAHGVELDVRFTSDGEPVVHHDPTALGENGDIDIGSTPWSVLSDARLRSGQGVYCVHHLEAVLQGLAGHGLINIEIKTVDPNWAARAAATVAGLVQKAGLSQSLVVSSFDLSILGHWEEARTGIQAAFIFSHTLPDLSEPLDRGWSLHPGYSLVDDMLMTQAGRAGVQVRPWTVDHPQDARRLAALGVQAIITNHPDTIAGCF